MRRRAVLATIGTTATAGCSSIDIRLDSDDDGHPLADGTQTVRVDNDSSTDHDVLQNTREALSFWEEHSTSYVDFEVGFELVDEPESDIVIAYADSSQGCESVEGYSERVMGCAPLIRVGNSITRPVTARVVAGARPIGAIQTTTTHEIGHMLGLGHGDEPRRIMSTRPEDRIPLYDVRIDIWETVVEARETGVQASSEFDAGSRAWKQESYDQAESHFETARDHYVEMGGLLSDAADRTVEFEGHERADTVALVGLRGHLDRLSRQKDVAVTFCREMRDASRSARRGETETANESLAQANEHIREFEDIGSPELRDIAVALGLVRGLDRDEGVVGIDEEPA